MRKRAFQGCLFGCFVLLGFLVLAAFVKHQADSPPPGIVLEPDLVFGTGGRQPLHLDLARPRQGSGPFPALVLVHGGAWIGGDKESLRSFLYYFAQRGIVCISIEYRLSPQNRFPAQVEDVKCAVRWLRAHASDYHIDRNRIGALGGSAGAHLVALLGTTNGEKKWEGSGGNAEQSSAICAMICMSGPYDLTRIYHDTLQQKEEEGRNVRSALEGLLGGTPSQEAALYQAASPISYVSKNTVPTLLTHGTADTLVPIIQAETFAARLKEKGADADYLRLEGGEHSDFGKKPQETIAHIDAFVRKHLLDTRR